jgi:hypothetical protein
VAIEPSAAVDPLRIPKAVERFDPPLVDIFVEDGERRGKSKVNPAEAEVILREVEEIVADPVLSLVGGESARPRSIGVISLIGSEQAAFIQKSSWSASVKPPWYAIGSFAATAPPSRVTSVTSFSCR